MLAYLCQALDKVSLPSADVAELTVAEYYRNSFVSCSPCSNNTALIYIRIMGWQDDVHAKGQEYGLTSSLHWCGLIVGEPLANQLVRKLPLGKTMGTAIIVWSAVRPSLYSVALKLR